MFFVFFVRVKRSQTVERDVRPGFFQQRDLIPADPIDWFQVSSDEKTTGRLAFELAQAGRSQMAGRDVSDGRS